MSVEEGAPRWGRVSMASTPQSPQRRRIWGWLGGWLPLPQVRQQSYKRRTWPNWLFLGSFLISEDSSDVHVVEQVTANSLKRRITSQGNKKPPTHTHTHTHTHRGCLQTHFRDGEWTCGNLCDFCLSSLLTEASPLICWPAPFGLLVVNAKLKVTSVLGVHDSIPWYLGSSKPGIFLEFSFYCGMKWVLPQDLICDSFNFMQLTEPLVGV